VKNHLCSVQKILLCVCPTGIKAIKLYAWEAPYLSRITQLRETELRAIRKTQMLSMVRALQPCVGTLQFNTSSAVWWATESPEPSVPRSETVAWLLCAGAVFTSLVFFVHVCCVTIMLTSCDYVSNY
jgi:hypothetical protein